MKVFFINSFFSAGGPPRVVDGIIQALHRHGGECVLAAGRETPPDNVPVVHVGGPLNKYRHWLASYWLDAQGLCSAGATRDLIRAMEQYHPDVIHLHNLHGYYLHIEVLFAYLKKAGIPVVWTLHDCWAMTGHCAHFDYIGCQKWLTGCFDCPQTGRYPVCRGLDRSRSNYIRKKAAFCGVPAMTLVTPSQWLCDLVGHSFLKEYPVRLIYNGIDLEHFFPHPGNLREELGLNGKKIILGVAQIWGERKGWDTFLELSQKLPPEYQIILIGVDEKQQRELPAGIIGVKRTKNIQELCAYYSIADVFVNPTLEEVLALTNLEALACGTPVITYNTGGSPECIDESCGIAVPRGDFEQLYQAIVTMNKSSYPAELCMKRAAKFSSEVKYQEYYRLYQDILSR